MESAPRWKQACAPVLCRASKDAPCDELASGVIGARTRVSGPGVVRLAERSNPHWIATLNGKRLSAAEPTNRWGQAFTVPKLAK